MKRKNTTKLISLFLTFTAVFSGLASVYAEDEWQAVSSNDFSSSDGITLTTPELTGGFTSTVTNGALEIKSNDICEWVANDLTSPNSTANTASGIKIDGLGSAMSKYDEGYAYDSKTYEYTGKSDVDFAMENVGGKNAMRLLYYLKMKSDGTVDKITSNYYKMKIADNSKTLDYLPGTYDFEVDIYMPSGKVPNGLTIWISHENGVNTYINNPGTELGTDSWVTWKFTLTNPKLDNAMQLQLRNSAFPMTCYVSRFSIKKAKSETPVYSEKEKTTILDLGLDDAYGNTAVSFDMELPDEEKLSNTVIYNKRVKNSGRVGIADENGTQLAAVQIDTKANGDQTLYAVTGGATELEPLYTGDILGKNLNYRFETDWVAETYTVAITEDGEPIDENTTVYGPYKMTNASADGNSSVRKLRVTHHSENTAMMTRIDNIITEYIENPSYAMCKVDADALVLDIPESGIVTEGCALPTTGETSGATITWSSSDNSVLSISDTGDSFTVTRGAVQKTVTLTAIYEIHGIQVPKEIEITVEKHESQLQAEADADALTLNIPEDKVITRGFALPAVGTENSSVITWASNSLSVVVSTEGTSCSLVRGAERVNAKLTATATKDGYTATKTFDVIVEKHEDKLKAEADTAAISLDIPDTGRLQNDFTLPSVGTVNAGAISWASNKADVLKIEGNQAVVTRGAEDVEVQLIATVTVGDYTASRTYYLTSASLVGTYAMVGEIESTVENNKLSATVDVSCPGRKGTLNFAAFVTNPETGEIVAKGQFTKALDSDTEYSTVSCSISNVDVPEGTEVTYYTWLDDGDNRITRKSLVNSAPSSVADLTADGKGKGVRLNWTKSVDDNDAVQAYSVYRDGVYIGSAEENTYLDGTAEIGKVYTYSVIPSDTNNLNGIPVLQECTPAVQMFYLDFDKKGRGEEDYMYGMGDYEFSDNETKLEYAVVQEITDANGETCYAAKTKYQGYIKCIVDTEYITQSDNNLVIEFEYLDTTGDIQFMYNRALPEGVVDDSSNMWTYARYTIKPNPVTSMTNTNTWKTGVVRLTDAALRKACGNYDDFNFYGTNTSLCIRKISIIDGDLYD